MCKHFTRFTGTKVQRLTLGCRGTRERSTAEVVCKHGEFETRLWRNLRVGDIVRVSRGQPLPADVVQVSAFSSYLNIDRVSRGQPLPADVVQVSATEEKANTYSAYATHVCVAYAERMRSVCRAYAERHECRQLRRRPTPPTAHTLRMYALRMRSAKEYECRQLRRRPTPTAHTLRMYALRMYA